MSEQETANRVFELLRQAGCKPHDLRDYLNVTDQVISNWRKRSRVPSSRLLSIARFLSIKLHRPVTVEELETGEKSLAERVQHSAFTRELADEIPVIGTIQTGPNKKWLNNECPNDYYNSYIDVPTKDLQAYALWICGTDLDPRYREGELILVSPNTKPCSGDEVIITLKDGGIIFKELIYIRHAQIALKNIHSNNQHFIINDKDIDFLHVVTGSLRRNSVKER